MCFGVPHSISSFVGIFLGHKITDRVQAFTNVIWLDATQDYTPEEWDQWLRHQLNRQLQPARRTHEEKLRNAERSRAAQLEADARRFVKGKEQSKGSGKGSHPYSRSGQGRY